MSLLMMLHGLFDYVVLLCIITSIRSPPRHPDALGALSTRPSPLMCSLKRRRFPLRREQLATPALSIRHPTVLEKVLAGDS